MPEFNIMKELQQITLLIVPFLLAITCHEVAHGYVAYLLGDPTAKSQGRLTLNPISHLDPMGTLALVLTRMIGWAKPVPVNPRYFRNPRQGMVLVSVAGPAANFALAIAFAAALRGLDALYGGAPVTEMTMRVLQPVASICYLGVQINLALGFFNLLPIPPLDGSNILAGLLPYRLAYKYEEFGRYGFIAVIILAVTGVLGKIIGPLIQYGTTVLL